MSEGMVTENRPTALHFGDNSGECAKSGVVEEDKPVQRRFWRSSSWSASSSQQQQQHPQQQVQQSSGHRSRPSLPPLQPTGRTDDNRDWAPLTPRRDINRMKNGLEIKLDLAAVQRCRDSSEPSEMQMKRDKFAFYDKECSRVAEHIYLGSDAVARNRETLLANKITHVLNCVGFICKEYFPDDFEYNTLWLQDSPSEDITSILYDVFDYFEEVRELKGRVFVHCCQGVSRSTALVIAYLMWREGRSFEDAFQDVKAARGITNPNMGFACQLLQAQKRVHASPASPNSLLRMYRMAPHSSYDALHLVPKNISDPAPSALDSRGGFVVQVPSTIFVWLGRSCEVEMERLTRAAAAQVVRYERAEAPVVCIREGDEPAEFWEAFGKGPNQVGAAAQLLASDRKRVAAYDIDFELYHRALQGGVVPAAGAVPTHLPARDSGWSRLRKKVLSGSVREKKKPSSSSDEPSGSSSSSSSSAEESESCSRLCDKQLNNANCETLSDSPSSSSSSSPSSRGTRSSTPSPTCSCSSEDSCSSATTVSSYALPVLRFPSLLGSASDDMPVTPRFGRSASFNNNNKHASAGAPGSLRMDNGGSCWRRRRRVYAWPSLQRLDKLCRSDLSSGKVFVVVDDGSGKVFVWVSKRSWDAETTRDWEQVGVGLLDPADNKARVLVVEEGREPEDFWSLCR